MARTTRATVEDVAAVEEEGKPKARRARVRVVSADEAAGPAMLSLLPSFKLSLRAQDRSPETIKCYTYAVTRFADWCKATGRSERVRQVERADVEAFLAELLEGGAARTSAKGYFAWLAQFWRWCLEDGEVAVSPMAGMHPPRGDAKPRPVLREEQIGALVKACEADKSFFGLRDAALVRFLLDTGARRGALVRLTWKDVNLETGIVKLYAKRRSGIWDEYFGRLGRKALQAMDRYRRICGGHEHYRGADGAVWLGSHGPLGVKAVYAAVERRGMQAKPPIPGVYLHLFRHTFAHQFLAAGGSERDLRRLGNWRSDVALIYGAVLDMERALANKEKPGMSLSDRF